MPLVAVDPSSGMGNQLFMLAAALGYAERYGLTPVFWKERDSSWEHKGSRFRIREMVPWMRVLTEEERHCTWMVLREPWELIFTYTPLPYHRNANVKLEGFFQSDFYGPSRFPTPPPPLSLRPELILHPWHRTFFLHVRRGDYLHPANQHHAVDLRDYWRTCLREMPDRNAICFVVSDDMEWCQWELKDIVGSAWEGEWLWCPTECTDVETFFWMMACDRGGICANSSFSWWAAWYLRRRVGSRATVYMPTHWGYAPLPPTRHLHPAWALLR